MNNLIGHELLGAFYTVAMPDGSVWGVPVRAIAVNRANYYAEEFNNDAQESMAKDTLPLFESDLKEIRDWAANNMNWSDVSSYAVTMTPADVDYEDGWCNGEYKIITDLEAES